MSESSEGKQNITNFYLANRQEYISHEVIEGEGVRPDVQVKFKQVNPDTTQEVTVVFEPDGAWLPQSVKIITFDNGSRQQMGGEVSWSGADKDFHDNPKWVTDAMKGALAALALDRIKSDF